MNMNKVIFIGRLTEDVVLNRINGKDLVVNFTVAVNQKWTSKDGVAKEEVTWIDCSAWGRTAEIMAGGYKGGSPMEKGQVVAVEGQLRSRTWKDKDTGKNRSKLGVRVDRMQMGPKAGEKKGSVEVVDVSSKKKGKKVASKKGAKVEVVTIAKS